MNQRCINILTVKGSDSMLRAFDEHFSKDHIGFVKIPDDTDKQDIPHEGDPFFVKYVTKEEIFTGYSLENFIPRPYEAFESETNEWVLNNWGTFYDILSEDVVKCRCGNAVTYTITTYLKPIIPVVKEMSRFFPDLSFDYMYSEGVYGGKDSAGEILFKEGKVISSNIVRKLQEIRKFELEKMGCSFHICNDCGRLLNDFELKNHDNGCYCGSKNITPKEDNTIYFDF